MYKIILYLIITHITFIYGNVISVTTFKNNTSNSKNIWIGEMIADNLTSDLSNFNSLQIINRSHLKDILKVFRCAVSDWQIQSAAGSVESVLFTYLNC